MGLGERDVRHFAEDGLSDDGWIKPAREVAYPAGGDATECEDGLNRHRSLLASSYREKC